MASAGADSDGAAPVWANAGRAVASVPASRADMSKARSISTIFAWISILASPK